MNADDGAPITGLFGATVRELRLRRKLSQLQLAELAGLDRTFVNGVENGSHSPTVVSVIRLAHALGVPPAQMFRKFDKAFMEKVEFK